MDRRLIDLIEKAKAKVASMTDDEIKAMLQKQAESWAKSEVQWAKEFREGKVERD